MPGEIWNLPALPPPPGQKSNFVNPDSRDTELIVMNAVFLSATAVAVVVRFVARRSAKDVVGWDGSKTARFVLVVLLLISDSHVYYCDARIGCS